MGKTKLVNHTLDLKLGFATLIAIFLVFGVFVLYDIQRVADLSRTIHDHPLVVSNAALQANTSIAKMHRNMKDVVLFKSSSRIQESLKAVDEEEKQVYRHLNAVRENILGEQGKILEQEARQLFDEWRPIRSEVIELVNNNQRRIAADITIGKGADHVDVLEEKMIGLTNYARLKGSEFTDDTQRVHSRLKVTSIFFLIVGTLSSLLIAFMVLKRNYSASKNLLEGEARYRSLIEKQTDLVCRFTSDGKFSFVNDIYCTFFNMSEKELIGSKWQPLPVDDDVEFINEKLSTLSPKNPTVVIENRVRSGKGKIHWMHFSNSGIFDSQENLLEIQSVGRDITDRKKSEEALLKSEARYARAVRGTTDGLWDWNIVTNEDYLSPRWKELLGFAVDELANEYETFFSRVHPDDVSRVQEAINAHLEQCTPYNIKHRLRTKSGEYKWFQVRGMAERDEQGQAVIMSGSITDITEFMQAEVENEKLERQLRQAQKLEAVGQLASGIAHEINTPSQYIGTNIEFLDEAFREIINIFSSIQAGTNVLEQGKSVAPKLEEIFKEADWEYLSEEIPNAIKQSKEGILLVSSIVRAMKEFSHPGGKSKEPADLNHIITNTVTVARNEWKYVANVETDFDTNVPPIPLFINEMGQVVLILLVNAAQAIAEKLGDNPTDEKGTITITTSVQGSGIQLRISDTGMGIPKTVRPRIFDPFYTTKIVGKGTGQGLAIAHDVVTAKHGGTIDFTTKTGQGTEFVIWLPIKKVNV